MSGRGTSSWCLGGKNCEGCKSEFLYFVCVCTCHGKRTEEEVAAAKDRYEAVFAPVPKKRGRKT